MQEPYIKSEELFNSIKEDFYSFDNAGLIDEGQFYRHVSYILKLLGIAWFEEYDDILPVEHYKVELPKNFYMLDQAYRCWPLVSADTTVQPEGVVLTERRFDHFPEECNTNECMRHVDTSCILNQYQQLVVQRNNFTGNFSGFALLKIGNNKTKSLCTGNCANLQSNSPDSITIQGNNMFTNFERGHVYVKLLIFPLDEETGLPLIPNNERIMKCIEYYIKSKLLENYWVNGDGDVAQKIQYFQAQYQTALGDAMYETKLPTFNTMLNAVRLVRKKLNVYQMWPALPGFYPMYPASWGLPAR